MLPFIARGIRYARAFVQFGYHNVFGKTAASTGTERSQTDVQQAFVEGTIPFSDNQKLTLRVGRQEMPLGSQRLVSMREGPNIRQSFDAVRGFYKYGANNLTAFVSQPVKTGGNNFDDEGDDDQAFWGFYDTSPIVENLNADVYFLRLIGITQNLHKAQPMNIATASAQGCGIINQCSTITLNLFISLANLVAATLVHGPQHPTQATHSKQRRGSHALELS